jgi:hypothetical protein
MEVPWLLVVHGSVTALVVVSFLCGQWPIFEGTFIQSINHFLTFGAYHYLLYVFSPPFPMSLPSFLLLLSEGIVPAGGLCSLCAVLGLGISSSALSDTAAIDPTRYCRYMPLISI